MWIWKIIFQEWQPGRCAHDIPVIFKLKSGGIRLGIADYKGIGVQEKAAKTRNAMAEIHSHISDEMFRKKQERSKDYER